VTITNGIHETVCGFSYGNHSDIQCEVQSELGSNQMIVTAHDKQGNSARIARNFSFDVYQVEPPETTGIMIYGKITDTAGRALPGVAVVTEPLSNPPNREDYVKKSTTHVNGTYEIEDRIPPGFNYERNISVEKEGYESIKKKITIIKGNRTSEQNFILAPQNKALAGFDFPVAASALVIISLLAWFRRERS
jgi:hypothetical protein